MLDNRYLIDFNTEDIDAEFYDVIIIGSGIAGLSTALEIPEEFNVVVLAKKNVDIANSMLAQGGIAASLDKQDSPELHFKDTLYAGAGLCNEEAVRVLVNQSVDNIDRLCSFGVNFDRYGTTLSLGREGAHSKNRVVHAGDTTGKEVCEKLVSAVKNRKNVEIKERIFALDLLSEGDVCKGILVYDEGTSALKLYLSHVVVCATGGYGQLYVNTTNSEGSTGDGACLAYRAGAELMNLEFVQFHPTVLYHPADKSFLISEAVRGEGAQLRNAEGIRFMPDYHELCELAPRDVVSRAIFEEMRKAGVSNVYLDITFKSKEYLQNRFPNIYKTCLGYGIDMSKDFIPVAPAEHYCIGGIKTDIFGRTNISRFYACGEVACNGIHGANRLACNSMLEGLVFSRMVSIDVKKVLKESSREKINFTIRSETGRVPKKFDRDDVLSDVKKLLTENVGIIRERNDMLLARSQIDAYYEILRNMKNETIKDFELQNIVLLSKLLIKSALEREESRGTHFRSEYPSKDDRKWRKNIIRKIESMLPAAEAAGKN